MGKSFVLLLIFVIFFVISFITNILGSLNPDVIKNFGLSLTLSALLPFAFFIAYGMFSIPAGMLVEKYKEKITMLVAFSLAFSGALMFSMWPKFPVFILSLFLMGSGMAMLQVAINPLLRSVGGEKHFAFFSVMAQLVFGGASFIAPMFLNHLVSSINANEVTKFVFSANIFSEMPWLSLYWIFTLILIFMACLIAGISLPVVQRNADELVGTWRTYPYLFRKKTVIYYFFAIFAYVGTEQGVSYWLSKFLEVYHGIDPLTVGNAIVGKFWGMMAIGCLVGLILLKLTKSQNILIGAVIMAAVALSLALFGPTYITFFAFPAIGFAISVMWSIVFALALNSLDSHHGSFAGILCTAIIGGAVIQLIIGWLGDMFGLRVGMCFIYLTLAYLFFIGLWAKPMIENKTIWE